MNKKIIPCNTLFNFVVYTAILAGVFSSKGSSEPYVTAYLDPGTGTMIISAIVGILATLMLGIKTFWYKVKTVLILKTKKEKKS